MRERESVCAVFSSCERGKNPSLCGGVELTGV